MTNAIENEKNAIKIDWKNETMTNLAVQFVNAESELAYIKSVIIRKIMNPECTDDIVQINWSKIRKMGFEQIGQIE